jgi:hypothetical protein
MLLSLIIKSNNIMKYAFVFGSSAFVVPNGVISYADSNHIKEILRIQSIYHDNKSGSVLSIDLDITDNKGNEVKLIANKKEFGSLFTVQQERDSVKVLNSDGSLLIQVHQLDDKSAMSLEHNITAEFEVNMPLAVIRISGDFMAHGIRVIAENEKLYVNNEGYATSAMAGNHLRFTAAGIDL